MSWDNAPTAIDGTELKGEDLRRGLYVTSPSQGIAGAGDLKVLPLSTPGNGFRVSPGGGLVYNRYITPIRESYAVGMPTETIFPSAQMPASVGSPRSHLVAVTVGDPQYSNSSHPWFPAVFPGVEDPLTYEYTRTWLFQNVPAGSGQAWLDANVPFPAMAIARLDMPASTTTVQASHIIDLRQVANPREKVVQWNVNGPTNDLLNVSGNFVYKKWPNTSNQDVAIPSWATKIYVDGFIHHFIRGGGVATVDAPMRVAIAGGSVAVQQNYYSTSAAEAGRKTTPLGSTITPTPAERGTTKTFQTEATYANAAAMADSLAADARTNIMVRLRFVEEAV